MSFNPLWIAELGDELPIKGRGLLVQGVERDKITRFVYIGGSFLLTAYPKDGELYSDGILTLRGQPGKLLWGRRMSIRLGTRDHNSSTPDCHYYFLGIDTGSARYGWRIMPDGTAHKWNG